MTDYSDLVKRLRSIPQRIKNGFIVYMSNEFPLCREAADAIEVLERDAVLVTDAMVALTDRVQELKAALKPFAYYAEQIPDDVSDMAAASGTVGDLRRAREVLGEKE